MIEAAVEQNEAPTNIIYFVEDSSTRMIDASSVNRYGLVDVSDSSVVTLTVELNNNLDSKENADCTPLYYHIIKRIFDIVASIILITLLCIPMMLIALLIRLDSPGPALFQQERLEQVIIRHNFGSCLLITIKAQLDKGFELVLNKPKCAFGRKGRDFVSPAASMMVAA